MDWRGVCRIMRDLPANAGTRAKRQRMKGILIGLAGTVIAISVVHYMIGWPFEEALSYFDGGQTPGKLISTEQIVEGDETGTHYSYDYEYTYTVGGIQFQVKKNRSGRLKEEYYELKDPIVVTVIYSKTFPRIS